MKARTPLFAALALTLALSVPARARPAAQQFPIIQLPAGYTIEKIVDGLTFATGMTWDDQGRMYVAEAGGGFLEEAPPPRILRVEPGTATEVANLEGKGVRDSLVGLTWHNGAFYITHRADDFTGAVSRVTTDGAVTQLFSGIGDSRSEHQVNDIRVGPDGRMYVASGPAGNSGVIGLDLAPFVGLSPDLHTTPCRDYVLTGQNYETPDFRTMDVEDTTQTGAFVPFGTTTMPGDRIAGSTKCGGAILQFDPADPEATLRPYADGFRNVIGFVWDADGAMYAAVNGYDVRGSRPVNDEWDATYRVREGAWYGFPDYSAALEPLTDPKFDSPDSLQAPVFVNGQPQGKGLGFVIDHANSGLQAPDRGLVAGLHDFGSSPSLLDIAPAGWGDLAGRIFVAEFGDLSPATNPLRNALTGYQITFLDPQSKRAIPFARNTKPGPASAQGAMGQGLERPFDVKFGPDGALYISDYGAVLVNPADAERGDDPYEFVPRTGAIWKISRAADAPPVMPPAPPSLRYQVTIDNLTQGQPFSPPVAATHRSGTRMFQLGQRASEALEAIAEDGNPAPMVASLNGAVMVSDVVNVGRPLTPQGSTRIVDGAPITSSATFEIMAAPGDVLSLATMLICTNDGFTGLDSMPLPLAGSQSYTLTSYDAGTENNTEQSQDLVEPCSLLGPVQLPGDPDGNVGVGPTDSPISTLPPAAIAAHPGITGNAELTSVHTWTDPVATVTVTLLGEGAAPPAAPAGAFAEFWQRNGGLEVFGEPLTAQQRIDGRAVQWYERQRFEHHDAAAPYNVQLGRLGAEALERRGIDWHALPTVDAAGPGCRFFAQTRHAVCGEMLGYWQSHGLEFDGRRGASDAESLALWGLPLSEARMETNVSGDTVLTQHFERARFEIHPNQPEPYRVLLGRLGAELLVGR